MPANSERFAEKTTPHVQALAAEHPALRSIYFAEDEQEPLPLDADVMLEKSLTVSKGLICKYPRRALMLLSYTCAAHCRYCERQDRVGVGLDAEGRLKEPEIRAAVDYLAQRPDISEVIFSGGDPLTAMPGLVHASRALSELPHVQVLRIHTRFPLQFPSAVKLDALEEIATAVPAFYFSLHVDHPAELTPEVEDIILALRRAGYLMVTQSVFLRGVNDDVDTLDELFSKLMGLGVRPYYIYHCMPIPTTMRFVMDLQEEVRIMSALRARLSGLALPVHVLELPRTTGKVAVPSNYWPSDYTRVHDFAGRAYSLDERGMIVGRAD